MKTTSYEISKKLKKNGLSEKLGFLEYYYNTDKRLRHRDQESYCSTDKENTQVDCFAYDLETILEALPKFIISDQKLLSPAFICYGQHGEEFLSCDKREDESWADAAARLLILLYNKGLINFNEER